MPEEFILHSGNAILSGKLYPKKDADTVILLHGGPGVPDEMTEVREALTSLMQVIIFDQRGTGRSMCRDCSYSIPEYTGDINHIADHFRLKKIHLFGHSWGGLYAQLYAHDFPGRIASLFLCSPASGTGKKIWGLNEKEVLDYNRKRTTHIEWMLMGLNYLLGWLGSSSAYRRLYRQVILNYHKGYNVEPPGPEKLSGINSRAGNRTRRAIKHYPPLGVFGKTAYPVIITYGQYDAYGNSKDYVPERFPYATVVEIPDCGHTPWKHNPIAFNRIVSDFYSL
jgi:proline iminopeptidase